eukprot:TRINITY_DN114_c5_g1_i1.p1 TRINITY_DN114_c5_g1~~TRINITY_DN114_c5_g1_i1.p1  ORF type:complete len:214 (-),score=49.39 TRINITY_DN114_c5_g1_i1:66-626(-)
MFRIAARRLLPPSCTYTHSATGLAVSGLRHISISARSCSAPPAVDTGVGVASQQQEQHQNPSEAVGDTGAGATSQQEEQPKPRRCVVHPILEDDSDDEKWLPKRIHGMKIGVVVSTKMAKTINVSVQRVQVVPKYGNRRIMHRKFFAHDEHEICNDGDRVVIVPCRRLSRHKHFRLLEVIKKAPQL